MDFDADDALAAPVFGEVRIDGTATDYAGFLARGIAIDGTAGADYLRGTRVNDRIAGGAGDDVLEGGLGCVVGNDELWRRAA